MIQNNIISFDKKPKAPIKKRRKLTRPASNLSISINQKVDLKIIEKSAQTFLESIISGTLYKELKPKDKASKSKITRI